MITPMYLAAVVLLVIYSKTDCSQPKGDEPRRCFQCSEPGCERGKGTLLSAVCPLEQPHCATIASSPNFTSTLTCAGVGKKPCTLMYSAAGYKMACSCQINLCNAPFSKELQTQLILFASVNSPNNRSDFASLFWKQSRFEETDGVDYENITAEAGTLALLRETTTRTPDVSTSFMPRAEAMRQETTVPSDDDEDESEGSGLEDEPHTPRNPASDLPADPAAPSSYLPADDNAAAATILNLLALIPTIFTIF